MSSHPNARTHPVRAFARQLTVRLDQLAPTAVWSMSPADQRDTLIELAKAKSQLAALELRVLAEADRSGATDTEAACSAADWLAVETHQLRRTVRSDLHLARVVEGHTCLAEAMRHGEVNLPQARAITTHWTGFPTPASSPSPTRTASGPRLTWSPWPQTTTPRSWRSWAARCSR